MAHSAQIKQNLREGYINKRLPLTVLSNKYNVSYATAQSWKLKAKNSGDDWDVARSASSITNATGLANKAVADFETLFENVYQEVLNDDEASALDKVQALATLSDAKIKTVKAAGMTDPSKAKLGIALETLSELVEYIKLNHNKKLGDLVVILQPFGEHINKKWG